MLKRYYNVLPFHELVQDEASAERIYGEILRYVADHGTDRHKGKAYFRMNKTEMEQISSTLEMSLKRVCEVLKENSLLYLTGSSVGNQTKVNYKGKADNYYCILNNFGTQSIPEYEPTVLEDGSKVNHDGTVDVPSLLYQQLFGKVTTSALPSGNAQNAQNTKNTKKDTKGLAWASDL
jgi:hypothetical protein